MLLAVEGGGFFSSSASGYTNGLSLLLLGQNNDDKHMKVAPLTQYPLLVDQVSDSNLQLASGQDRPPRGCASFVCFGRASAGVDIQSPLKVGPTTQPHGVLSNGSAIERDKELSAVVECDNRFANISLKSSLKKPSQNMSQTISPTTIKDDNEQEPLAEDGADLSEPTERRKVQWTDACGKELAEVREFELSEAGESDDEFISGNRKTCLCRIM